MTSASPVRVARTGRKHQRYENGYRLVAGCIPYRINRRVPSGSTHGNGGINGGGEEVEVMMISSQHGEGLLFPKGGWETDETAEEAAKREAMEEAGVLGLVEGLVGTFEFRSKRQRSEVCPEGRCRAHVFVLAVGEQLEEWPEQSTRRRRWLSVAEALEECRHEWMQGVLRQWSASLKQRHPEASSPAQDSN